MNHFYAEQVLKKELLYLLRIINRQLFYKQII